MGSFNEYEDEHCGNSPRKSGPGGRLVQSLSGIPTWVALAGGIALGKMLRRSSSSHSMDVESDAHNTSSVENGVCEEAVVSCGPWGGQGGTQFCDGRGDIKEIVITHTTEHIMCIQSNYNQGGANFKASAHGTPTEGQITEITLQWPDEYLVQVKGTTDTCATIGVVVASLTFITNKQVYGPYGKENGDRFESLPGGKVVGFFGKSGTLLDQFGVLTQHLTELHATPSLLVSADKGKNVVGGGNSGSVTDVEGPWGGVEGSAFHDGHGRVVEIFITYQKNQITSFQATYEHGGVHFKGSLHGIASGTRTKIALKPSEYLVQVKGTAGKIFGSEAITSLIFVTNQRVFGPYGRFTGRAFESSSETREVSGFFGRCGSRLDQIGVITKFAQHNHQNVATTVQVQGPWGGQHGSQFCSGRGELEDIYVTFNKVHIVALQATYNLGSKVDSIRSDCWGGNIGETVQVRLRSCGEIVTQIKGTIDVLRNGTTVVTSLTFITNKGVYGPYGLTVGNGFESTPGKVIGFYGRSDSLLHQIGVITETSSSDSSREFTERPRSSVKRSSSSTASDGTLEASQEPNHRIFSSDNGDENHKISFPSTATQCSSSTSRSANGDTKLSNHSSGYESIDSGRLQVGEGTSQPSSSHSIDRGTVHGSVNEEACSLDQDGTRVHGPWGGLGGDVFCDGRGEIVEILVTFNAQQVVSLQVSYAHGSSTFRGTSHGGRGDHTAKICLRHPEEYLVQVKGTTGSFPSGDGITSLMFITNENMYGPFGCSTTQMGTSFQSPSGSQKVTGFFGRSCMFLNQVGVFTAGSKDSDLGNCRTVEGPWGGLGGAPFYDGSGDIVEMVVAYDEMQIISFQTTYGHSGLGFTTGISAHPRHDTTKIKMHFMNEYLVQVKGTVGFINGSGEVITSLTFVTNKKSYGPYGNVQGLGFESSSNGKVVGFFGKSGSQLDQIGVIKEYVVVGKDFVVSDGGHWEGNSWKEFFNEGASTTQACDLNNVVVQGPWGGQGGDSFYDGRGDIVEIVITHNQSQILSFQAIYDQGGVDFQAENHGGGNGAVATIKLGILDEYLIQVQGTVGSVLQENVITSLTFITNKHRYGPYGSVSGREFHSSSSGCIVGFYGRSSSTSLDQLGFIKSIMPSQKLTTDSDGIMGTSSTIHCDHDVLVIPQGPWGGCGGDPFYDGRGEIVDLNINFTDTLITSIQVGYEQGGIGFQGGLHGGKGIRQVKIHMNSEEILLQVHGTSATVNGLHGITSLAFATNKRVYGPYGTAHGRRFQSSPGGQVVGFFGQSSDIVNQLGVVTLIFTSTHSARCKYYTRHNHSCCKPHDLSYPRSNRYSRQEIYQPSLTVAATQALHSTSKNVQTQLLGTPTFQGNGAYDVHRQTEHADVVTSDNEFIERNHLVSQHVPNSNITTTRSTDVSREVLTSSTDKHQTHFDNQKKHITSISDTTTITNNIATHKPALAQVGNIRNMPKHNDTDQPVRSAPDTHTTQKWHERPETSKPADEVTGATGIHGATGIADTAIEHGEVTLHIPNRELDSLDVTEKQVSLSPETHTTQWHTKPELLEPTDEVTVTTGSDGTTCSVDAAFEHGEITLHIPNKELGSHDVTDEPLSLSLETHTTERHIKAELLEAGEEVTSATGIDSTTCSVDAALEHSELVLHIPNRELGSHDVTGEPLSLSPETHTSERHIRPELLEPAEEVTSATGIESPTWSVEAAFKHGEVSLHIPNKELGSHDVKGEPLCLSPETRTTEWHIKPEILEPAAEVTSATGIDSSTSSVDAAFEYGEVTLHIPNRNLGSHDVTDEPLSLSPATHATERHIKPELLDPAVEVTSAPGIDSTTCSVDAALEAGEGPLHIPNRDLGSHDPTGEPLSLSPETHTSERHIKSELLEPAEEVTSATGIESTTWNVDAAFEHGKVTLHIPHKVLGSHDVKDKQLCLSPETHNTERHIKRELLEPAEDVTSATSIDRTTCSVDAAFEHGEVTLHIPNRDLGSHDVTNEPLSLSPATHTTERHIKPELLEPAEEVTTTTGTDSVTCSVDAGLEQGEVMLHIPNRELGSHDVTEEPLTLSPKAHTTERHIEPELLEPADEVSSATGIDSTSRSVDAAFKHGKVTLQIPSKDLGSHDVTCETHRTERHIKPEVLEPAEVVTSATGIESTTWSEDAAFEHHKVTLHIPKRELGSHDDTCKTHTTDRHIKAELLKAGEAVTSATGTDTTTSSADAAFKHGKGTLHILDTQLGSHDGKDEPLSLSPKTHTSERHIKAELLKPAEVVTSATGIDSTTWNVDAAFEHVEGTLHILDRQLGSHDGTDEPLSLSPKTHTSERHIKAELLEAAEVVTSATGIDSTTWSVDAAFEHGEGTLHILDRQLGSHDGTDEPLSLSPKTHTSERHIKAEHLEAAEVVTSATGIDSTTWNVDAAFEHVEGTLHILDRQLGSHDGTDESLSLSPKTHTSERHIKAEHLEAAEEVTSATGIDSTTWNVDAAFEHVEGTLHILDRQLGSHDGTDEPLSLSPKTHTSERHIKAELLEAAEVVTSATGIDSTTWSVDAAFEHGEGTLHILDRQLGSHDGTDESLSLSPKTHTSERHIKAELLEPAEVVTSATGIGSTTWNVDAAFEHGEGTLHILDRQLGSHDGTDEPLSLSPKTHTGERHIKAELLEAAEVVTSATGIDSTTWSVDAAFEHGEGTLHILDRQLGSHDGTDEPLSLSPKTHTSERHIKAELLEPAEVVTSATGIGSTTWNVDAAFEHGEGTLHILDRQLGSHDGTDEPLSLSPKTHTGERHIKAELLEAAEVVTSATGIDSTTWSVDAAFEHGEGTLHILDRQLGSHDGTDEPLSLSPKTHTGERHIKAELLEAAEVVTSATGIDSTTWSVDAAFEHGEGTLHILDRQLGSHDGTDEPLSLSPKTHTSERHIKAELLEPAEVVTSATGIDSTTWNVDAAFEHVEGTLHILDRQLGSHDGTDEPLSLSPKTHTSERHIKAELLEPAEVVTSATGIGSTTWSVDAAFEHGEGTLHILDRQLGSHDGTDEPLSLSPKTHTSERHIKAELLEPAEVVTSATGIGSTTWNVDAAFEHGEGTLHILDRQLGSHDGTDEPLSLSPKTHTSERHIKAELLEPAEVVTSATGIDSTTWSVDAAFEHGEGTLHILDRQLGSHDGTDEPLSLSPKTHTSERHIKAELLEAAEVVTSATGIDSTTWSVDAAFEHGEGTLHILDRQLGSHDGTDEPLSLSPKTHTSERHIKAELLEAAEVVTSATGIDSTTWSVDAAFEHGEGTLHILDRQLGSHDGTDEPLSLSPKTHTSERHIKAELLEPAEVVTSATGIGSTTWNVDAAFEHGEGTLHILDRQLGSHDGTDEPLSLSPKTHTSERHIKAELLEAAEVVTSATGIGSTTWNVDAAFEHGEGTLHILDRQLGSHDGTDEPLSLSPKTHTSERHIKAELLEAAEVVTSATGIDSTTWSVDAAFEHGEGTLHILDRQLGSHDGTDEPLSLSPKTHTSERHIKAELLEPAEVVTSATGIDSTTWSVDAAFEHGEGTLHILDRQLGSHDGTDEPLSLSPKTHTSERHIKAELLEPAEVVTSATGIDSTTWNVDAAFEHVEGTLHILDRQLGSHDGTDEPLSLSPKTHTSERHIKAELLEPAEVVTSATGIGSTTWNVDAAFEHGEGTLHILDRQLGSHDGTDEPLSLSPKTHTSERHIKAELLEAAEVVTSATGIDSTTWSVDAAFEHGEGTLHILDRQLGSHDGTDEPLSLSPKTHTSERHIKAELLEPAEVVTSATGIDSTTWNVDAAFEHVEGTLHILDRQLGSHDGTDEPLSLSPKTHTSERHIKAELLEAAEVVTSATGIGSTTWNVDAAFEHGEGTLHILDRQLGSHDGTDEPLSLSPKTHTSERHIKAELLEAAEVVTSATGIDSTTWSVDAAFEHGEGTLHILDRQLGSHDGTDEPLSLSPKTHTSERHIKAELLEPAEVVTSATGIDSTTWSVDAAFEHGEGTLHILDRQLGSHDGTDEPLSLSPKTHTSERHIKAELLEAAEVVTSATGIDSTTWSVDAAFEHGEGTLHILDRQLGSHDGTDEPLSLSPKTHTSERHIKAELLEPAEVVTSATGIDSTTWNVDAAFEHVEGTLHILDRQLGSHDGTDEPLSLSPKTHTSERHIKAGLLEPAEVVTSATGIDSTTWNVDAAFEHGEGTLHILDRQLGSHDGTDEPLSLSPKTHTSERHIKAGPLEPAEVVTSATGIDSTTWNVDAAFEHGEGTLHILDRQLGSHDGTDEPLSLSPKTHTSERLIKAGLLEPAEVVTSATGIDSTTWNVDAAFEHGEGTLHILDRQLGSHDGTDEPLSLSPKTHTSERHIKAEHFEPAEVVTSATGIDSTTWNVDAAFEHVEGTLHILDRQLGSHDGTDEPLSLSPKTHTSERHIKAEHLEAAEVVTSATGIDSTTWNVDATFEYGEGTLHILDRQLGSHDGTDEPLSLSPKTHTSERHIKAEVLEAAEDVTSATGIDSTSGSVDSAFVNEKVTLHIPFKELGSHDVTGEPLCLSSGTQMTLRHFEPELLEPADEVTSAFGIDSTSRSLDSTFEHGEVTLHIPSKELGSHDVTCDTHTTEKHIKAELLVPAEEVTSASGIDCTTCSVDAAFKHGEGTLHIPNRELGSHDVTDEPLSLSPKTHTSERHIKAELLEPAEVVVSATGIDSTTCSVDAAFEHGEVTLHVPNRELGSHDGTDEPLSLSPKIHTSERHIKAELLEPAEAVTSAFGIDSTTCSVDAALEHGERTLFVPDRDYGRQDVSKDPLSMSLGIHTTHWHTVGEPSVPGYERTSTIGIPVPAGSVAAIFEHGKVLPEVPNFLESDVTGASGFWSGFCLKSEKECISEVDSKFESPMFGGLDVPLSDLSRSFFADSESDSRSSYAISSESSESSELSYSSKSSHSSHSSGASESSRFSDPFKPSKSSKLSKLSKSSNSSSKSFKSMVSNSGFELKHGFYDRSKVEIGDEGPSDCGTSDELHGLSNNSTAGSIGSSPGEVFTFEGPWGGEGGFEFNGFMGEGGFEFHGCSGEIVEIEVFHTTSHLTGMHVRYCTSGSRLEGQKYGENGTICSKIRLDSSNEFIIRLTGTYAWVHGHQIITSISFYSNKVVYGPYGVVVGEKFSSSGSGKVVGFFGRAGSFIDQIGVVRTRKPEEEVIVQGPWGGEEGSPFYDGRGDIAEVLVEYTDDYIISLQVTYEQDASIFKTSARFGPGGNTYKIIFDPQEHLLQIQGSIGDSFGGDMVNSLTFVTTKQTYGPFGSVTVNKFESKMHGKIVGFYGRSDEFLYRIGVITEVSPEDPVIVLSQGPWGGQNGTSFYNGKGEVVGINITYNKRQIISLQTIYGQGDAIFEADFYGGPGGKTAKILFKAPSEELVQVKGTTGKVDGELVVTSLTVVSNQRVYGPFGRVRSTEFQSSPNGKVYGLYGKAKNCLVQIGFFTTFPSEKCAGQIVAQGPWGGLGGHVFYEGRGNLLGITVGYSKTHVISLQMTYEHNGTEYEGERHGGSGGQLTQISLKESGSYLVQVKGTFGKIGGEVSVTSVMFITNKDSFGPFGTARGHQFQSSRQGKVVGFFGNSSALIDQLGVVTKLHAKSQQNVPPALSMGPWGGQGGKAFHDGEGDIHEIHLQYSNSHINSLQVVYKQGDNVLHAAKHGKTSGGSRIKVPFTAPGEYLMQIKGTYGQVSEVERIISLMFISNKDTYGPFGQATGTDFQSPTGTRIVGFFGRAAASVDQIGVVVQAIEAPQA